MLGTIFDDKPWFAPKRFGYGAGLPIAWKGWVLILSHVALLAGIAVALPGRSLMGLALLTFAVLVPLPLYRAKTRGGWKWRNGEKD